MKLDDWTRLPVEVLKDVCLVAGVPHDAYTGDNADLIVDSPMMVAALAFGGLAVLGRFSHPQVCEDHGKWRIVFDFTDPQPKWWDTFPEAVLAALRRMYGDN